MKKNYVFGQHAVKTLLINHPDKILELWCQVERYHELASYVQQQKLKVQIVNKSTLETLLPGMNHQGFIAKIVMNQEKSESDLNGLVKRLGNQLKLLILDGIEDPHNLGACLRTACALGINGVLLPKDKSCGITSTVYKVASGAVDEIPIFKVVNLARVLENLKRQQIWIYGASEHGTHNLGELKFHQPWALVFGNEGFGMRRLTQAKCDLIFKIPMQHPLVNSLNVSVAVGIGLFTAINNGD